MPTKSIEDHVGPSIDKILSAWDPELEFFLDPTEVASGLTATGINGAQFAFDYAAKIGLSFVPVTAPGRSTSEHAAALAHAGSRGLCLRASLTELGHLSSFMATNGLTEAHVDLVVDMGSADAGVLALAIPILNVIPNVKAWRTLTFLATSFPASLGGMTGLHLLDRSEWIAWASLHAARAALPRLPSFGDYAIQSPDVGDGYDPRVMPMSAAIRYTLPTQWLILRGVSSKKQKLADQLPNLAKQLVGYPGFNNLHCDGCADAARCAGGASGYGSLGVWRRIGTAHHLTFATDQVSALLFP